MQSNVLNLFLPLGVGTRLNSMFSLVETYNPKETFCRLSIMSIKRKSSKTQGGNKK